jgi:hypothetical protein
MTRGTKIRRVRPSRRMSTARYSQSRFLPRLRIMRLLAATSRGASYNSCTPRTVLRAIGYSTAISSTSKTSVAYGGITPPTPALP